MVHALLPLPRISESFFCVHNHLSHICNMPWIKQWEEETKRELRWARKDASVEEKRVLTCFEVKKKHIWLLQSNGKEKRFRQQRCQGHSLYDQRKQVQLCRGNNCSPKRTWTSYKVVVSFMFRSGTGFFQLFFLRSIFGFKKNGSIFVITPASAKTMKSILVSRGPWRNVWSPSLKFLSHICVSTSRSSWLFFLCIIVVVQIDNKH